MEKKRPREITLLAGIYGIAIVASLAVAYVIIQKIPGSAGIRFGLIAIVIGTVHLAMLIGMMKKKQWGFELIQVMSKLFLIVSGLGLAAIFIMPSLWIPFLGAAVLAFTGYRFSNSEGFRAYFGKGPIPEQLTHL